MSGRTSSSSAHREAAARLGRTRGRRIPFVGQLQSVDCGAACLAMVLGHFGRRVGLSEVRDAIGIGPEGANALQLLAAARRQGLLARGVSIDIDDLAHLRPASILHWQFNHFVVFEGIRRGGVAIIDPASGRRVIPLAKFRRAFTGVALTFERGEGFEPRAAGGNRVWAYMRRLMGETNILPRVVAMSLVLRVLSLALPILTAVIVDRVVPRGDHDLLSLVGWGLALVVVFHFLSIWIRSQLVLELRTNLDVRLTIGFVDHLVDLPFEFFQTRPAGDLVTRVQSNAAIREIMTAATLSAIIDGFFGLSYLVAIVFFSPIIAAIVLAVAAAQALLWVTSKGRVQELMAQELEAKSRSQAYLVQMLAGIETLKLSAAGPRAVERWSGMFVDELNVALARGRLDALIEALRVALLMGAPLVVLAYGAVMVMEGVLGLGAMLAIGALATGFLTPLGELVGSGIRLAMLAGYIDRIDDVFDAQPERTGGGMKLALRGAVSLEEVQFRYGTHAPDVIKGVSVQIAPGRTVAIVGRSGSGKSTLARLLLGLYRPTAGAVCYDGNDLARLDLDDVRAQVGLVAQNPYVFAGTVRENIALGRPSATLAEIREAAAMACIDRDIEQMPMGYDTWISEGGASLSGGQRQRLALARVLLTQPRLLLLDEATSALDSVTEAAIVRNLSRLSCTTIIIAHRLSTVSRADEIFVLADGRVAEHGAHPDLIERRGIYCELVHAQSAANRGSA